MIPELPPGAWDEVDQERRFWEAHFDEYLTHYRDRFVAVDKRTGEVVADDPELAGFVALLRERGFDAGDTWSRFITERRPRVL